MKPSDPYKKRTIKVTRRKHISPKYNSSRVGSDPTEKLDEAKEFKTAVMPKRNRPKAKKLRNK